MAPVRRWRFTAAALLLGLLAGATGGCAVGGNDSPDADSPGAGSAGTSASAQPDVDVTSSPAAQARRVGSVVPQVPREIQLPNGHKVFVKAVSTTANGLLDVPSNIQAAGWWQGGARIGDPFGSTLIAAHVDSFTQGVGPFSALLGVRAGDRVIVWTRGLRQIFRVQSLNLRPRSAVIGTRSALHSPAGKRRLTLVTCAGPYVRSEGGYQNLAVVTALPVGDPVLRHG